MTDKIYLRPGIVETNKAKIDFLHDAFDVKIDTKEDLKVKDIYSPMTDEDTDVDTPS